MPKFSFSKFLSSVSCLLSPATSQRGQSSAYIILFVIVVIFAVMLSGGSSSLFSGNMPSSVIDTPTPSQSTTPSPSAAPSATGWNITVTLDGCKNDKTTYMAGTAKVEGPSDGTVELSVGTQTVGSQAFTNPSGTFPLSLTNESGFNTKTWKISVSSGGIIKKTYDGNPTGCT